MLVDREQVGLVSMQEHGGLMLAVHSVPGALWLYKTIVLRILTSAEENLQPHTRIHNSEADAQRNGTYLASVRPGTCQQGPVRNRQLVEIGYQ